MAPEPRRHEPSARVGRGAAPGYQYGDDAAIRFDQSSSEHNDEVSEINPHTLNREFHGPTSSLAFLAAIHRSYPEAVAHSPSLGDQALVSTFHNESFSPQSPRTLADQPYHKTRYYFRQSQRFLDGYFRNIHFIHPIIDRSQFLSKCEELWFGGPTRQSRSFVSLYFAVLSLGALTREWEEDLLDGENRWYWSRKMFGLAASFLGSVPLKMDLETVQANIIMAKICQNELNPHLAYMYLGMAVRLSLSAGHNRQSHSEVSASSSPEDSSISRTWWGLYSVEVEMSFALGRADSLGPDIYHNRLLPPIRDDETAILTPMVDCARIVRKISEYTYTTSTRIEHRLELAAEIEKEMNEWLQTLPKAIKPEVNGSLDDTGITREPMWSKKQKHTLRFRYHNCMMVLYRPFLLYVSRKPAHATSNNINIDRGVSKCVASARSTIQLMHRMYSTASYFRTWWYNTTYTLYASAIILGYFSRVASADEKAELQQLINMSIEVLQAMDEHVVAKKAASLLQHTWNSAQETHNFVDRGRNQTSPLANQGNFDTLPTTDFFLDSELGEDSDFMAQMFPVDEHGFLLA